MKKNIIFLMIDTLRYDRLGISGYRPDVTPTLDWLAKNGIHFTNMFAQGPATEMTFPCLHSSTYPLDYNGYTEGLKDRPWSVAEVLKANGYHTHCYMGMPMGRRYHAERGFDSFLNFGDFRNMINNLIKRDFLYYYRLSKNGIISVEEATDTLKARVGKMLDSIIDDFRENSHKNHYGFIKRQNVRFAKALMRERDLFRKDPKLTIEKIIKLGPDHFLNFLGKSKISHFLHLWYRILNFLFYAGDSILNKVLRYRLFRRLNAYANILNHNVRALLANEVKTPFFIYIHYCDVHDSMKLYDRSDFRKVFRGLKRFLKKFPWRSYEGDYTYDIGLSSLDLDLKDFLFFLKSSGFLKNSILVVNADHGDGRETSFPWRRMTLEKRFHREFLHIPFIIYHEDIDPQKIDKLCGQADVFPTLFDMVGIDAPEEFIGRSMLRDARKHLICEAVEAGNCDLSRKVLSFTYIDEQFKLTALLKGNILESFGFYDLRNDPWEMDNLVDDYRYRMAIDQREKIIYEERVKPIRTKHPFLGLVES